METGTLGNHHLHMVSSLDFSARIEISLELSFVKPFREGCGSLFSFSAQLAFCGACVGFSMVVVMSVMLGMLAWANS